MSVFHVSQVVVEKERTVDTVSQTTLDRARATERDGVSQQRRTAVERADGNEQRLARRCSDFGKSARTIAPFFFFFFFDYRARTLTEFACCGSIFDEQLVK
jgi:hypothetical protein